MSDSLPGWRSDVRVWGSSAETNPRSLSAGEDLVLQAPAAHAPDLETGVLLDDWLDQDAREAVNESALRALESWRAATGAALTVDGVPLGWLYEGELFADVFLREQRVADGLRAAFAGARPEAVRLAGVDPGTASMLTELLDELGVAVRIDGPAAPAPAYPITFARAARSRRGLGELRETAGLPARVRGRMLVKPHVHLTPLWAALLERGPVPVLDPFDRPALPARLLAAVAARGGWIGHPGGRARRASRAAVAAAVSSLPPAGDDPVARLCDARARELLRQLAADAPATVGVLRRAFRAGLDGAMMPSDGTPAGRAIEVAAREADARTIHVQHGFFSDLWRVDGRLAPFIDGLEASRAAVWSESQAAVLAEGARGEVSVTGNPGQAVAVQAGADPSGHAVVLPQPAGVSSATVDVRSPLRHVEDALSALRNAGSTRVVVRPHPLDGSDYEAAVARFPEIRSRIARTGTIDAVLAGASLCIGPLSTATLQAAAAGVPSVFLRSTEARLPWPFDDSGAFPTARDTDELTDLLPSLARAGDVAGADAAREALGERPDAVERVLALT